MRKVQALRFVVLFAIAFAASSVRAADTLSVSRAQAEAVGIETAPLEHQPAAIGLRFPARVVVPTNQTRHISAPLAGRIEVVAIKPDEAVRAGQVVAEMQSPAFARAQADFLQAFNQERLLRKTLEREQSLTPTVVTPKQLLATTNEHTQAVANLAERRHELRHFGMPDATIETLAASQSIDSKLVVTSPVDGVALEVPAVPGQTVEAMALLGRLAQLSPLWLEIQVPAARAAKFVVGAQIDIAGHVAVGHVVSIGASVDSAAQSVVVRAEITSPGHDLRPGQVVEALVMPATAKEREWRVLPSAIVRRGNDAFVFVRTQDGFRPTPVAVHEELPEFVVVSGSFSGEEQIAVRGLAALKGAWQGLGGVG